MTGQVQTTEPCIANISSPERRRRLVAGIVQLAISLMLLAILIATGMPRGWRLGLFFLFWGAASGFFQWLDKT